MISHKKSFRQVIVYDGRYHTPSLIKLLNDPEAAFSDGKATMLKDGDSTTVIKISIGHTPLVIKRYNILNFWHGLKRAFQKSRAYKSWVNARRLLDNQVLTATPIAYVEKRFGPLRGKAYYICEYINGEDALRYFKQLQKFDSSSQQIANAITEIFAAFQRSQISHGDMKATNIILQQEQPILVDLDAMRLHRFAWTFTRAYKKDLGRFIKNWQTNHAVKNYFQQLFAKKNLLF